MDKLMILNNLSNPLLETKLPGSNRDHFSICKPANKQN